MRGRRYRGCMVVARTLDDDGWCAYIRDSGGGLHKFDVEKNFFWTDEITKGLCFDVFSSAKAAHAHFKKLIHPFGKDMPIVWGKKHVEEHWSRYWREKMKGVLIPQEFYDKQAKQGA